MHACIQLSHYIVSTLVLYQWAACSRQPTALMTAPFRMKNAVHGRRSDYRIVDEGLALGPGMMHGRNIASF